MKSIVISSHMEVGGGIGRRSLGGGFGKYFVCWKEIQGGQSLERPCAFPPSRHCLLSGQSFCNPCMITSRDCMNFLQEN